MRPRLALQLKQRQRIPSICHSDTCTKVSRSLPIPTGDPLICVTASVINPRSTSPRESVTSSRSSKNRHAPHAVRDALVQDIMRELGFIKYSSTNCPTMKLSSPPFPACLVGKECEKLQQAANATCKQFCIERRPSPQKTTPGNVERSCRTMGKCTLAQTLCRTCMWNAQLQTGDRTHAVPLSQRYTVCRERCQYKWKTDSP